MINAFPFAALAILAGMSLALQQVMNSSLRIALNSAAWSGFVSYFVGTLCMAVLIFAMREPFPSLAVTGRIPWWAWSAGVFGAVFIGLAIFLLPKLGAATFFALLIAGQMIGSIVFDHFGLLGLQVQPVNVSRLLGVALLVGGVALIRL